MAPRGVRGSAEERKKDVLAAALVEFARGGLEGTSTESIARRAGISQPYLFRLYPGKKALFLAAVERTFDEVVDVFRRAAQGHTGVEAKHAMGEAYLELLGQNPTFLRMQLQAYASSAQDAEVRALTRREFGRLWETVITISGMSEPLAQAFIAHGMLCNLMGALGIPGEADENDSLTRRFLAEPVLMQLLIDDDQPAGAALAAVVEPA
jgi:AcrR family transcriptional regulator